MSSIIEGYNYDIFISYRQKDNKGDRWVSEFVDSLKTELESTFKEEISVYFDINPHDGLLETHDVDESLKEKLKCLVFIPIISRTYCDPKSFAWEHEFKAFVEQASRDRFGLKVKLPNGNVASRVLPVQIHDLDPDGKILCESVLGGFLRGIELIYKEPGIDRPLSAKDNEEKNLNKTNYRNQINKVALAIKDIVTAIKHQEQKPESISTEVSGTSKITRKNSRMKILTGSFVALLLIILSVLIFPKIINPEKTVIKSIAVLPFRNDSPDSANLFFCNGMMEDILDKLVKVEGLNVKSRTDVEPYRGTNKTITEIGRELEVDNILEGSVRKQGNRFKISLQLIVAKNGFHLWSDTYEGEYSEEIWTIQNDIAQKVATELKVKLTQEEKESVATLPTSSIQAYDYYLKGSDEMQKFWGNRDSRHSSEAIRLLNMALELDPRFEKAMRQKMWAHYGLKEYDSVLLYTDEVLSINPKSADAYFLRGFIYAADGKPDLSIENYKLAYENYSKNQVFERTRVETHIGATYCGGKGDFRNGLPWFQKSLSSEEYASPKYLLMGQIFRLIGDYQRTNRYFRKSLEVGVTPFIMEDFADALIFQSRYIEALSFLDTVCNKQERAVRCAHSRFNIYFAQKDYNRAEQQYSQFLVLSGIPGTSDSIRLAYLYKKTGREQLSSEILQKCKSTSERRIATKPDFGGYLNLSFVYSILDRRDEAIGCLSKAFDQIMGLAWFDYAEVFPIFENIKDDPEFKALIKRERDEKAEIRALVNEMVKRGEIEM